MYRTQGNDHGNNRAGSGCQVGGHGDFADFRNQGQGAAGVESEPAKPEEEDTQGAEGQTVTGDGVGGFVRIEFANAGSEDRRADEGQPAADGMDDGGTGKVMEAERSQPAAAPCPGTE